GLGHEGLLHDALRLPARLAALAGLLDNPHRSGLIRSTARARADRDIDAEALARSVRLPRPARGHLDVPSPGLDRPEAPDSRTGAARRDVHVLVLLLDERARRLAGRRQFPAKARAPGLGEADLEFLPDRTGKLRAVGRLVEGSHGDTSE